jgi:hypothetical protein
MAANLATIQQVRELQAKSQNALAKARAIKLNSSKQIEQATETVVQSLEVGGTAFGFGLVTGRYGGVEILGVPGDMAAALALHSVALFVDDEHTAEHLHNFGDGCMAAYLHTLGLGIGRRWSQEASTAHTALPAQESAADSA